MLQLVFVLVGGCLCTADELRFGVIGDWGYVSKPTSIKKMMKRIDEEASKDKLDFFITVGDNIYNDGIKSTSDKKFNEAMDLIRSNSHLKEVPLYASLGNHDCYGSVDAAVGMNGKEHYYMGGEYYHKDWDVDSNGSVDLTILFLNACKLVCKENKERHCSKMKMDYSKKKDKEAIDKHYEWIQEKLKSIKDDRWVAVAVHWPATGVASGNEFKVVQEYLLPILQKHKVDLYFGGHTHTTQYLTISYKQDNQQCEYQTSLLYYFLYGAEDESSCSWESTQQEDEETYSGCKKDQERVYEKQASFKKGEVMHQFIEGATGDGNLGTLCLDAKTLGKPYFASNLKNTYLRTTVTASEVKVEIRDVDGKSLYKAEIKK